MKKKELTPEQAASNEGRRKTADDLFAEYRRTGSIDVRNEIMLLFGWLVRYLAERLKTKLPESIDVGDLVSSGQIGLADAVEKFDLGLGVRFETYAPPRIRGAMLDEIRSLDWVPRLIRNRINQIARIEREFRQKFMRDPTEDDLAVALGMNAEEFLKLRAECCTKVQVSIESPYSQNDDPRDHSMLLSAFEDRRAETAATSAALQSRREFISERVRRLPPQQFMVITYYYFEGIAMKQIGEKMGLSESRICQIHDEVISQLRSSLESREEEFME